jgi:hypothetical protein
VLFSIKIIRRGYFQDDYSFNYFLAGLSVDTLSSAQTGCFKIQIILRMIYQQDYPYDFLSAGLSVRLFS